MDDGDIGMAIPNRTLSRKGALSKRSEGLATNECCLSEELSGRGDFPWWQEFSGKPQADSRGVRNVLFFSSIT